MAGRGGRGHRSGVRGVTRVKVDYPGSYIYPAPGGTEQTHSPLPTKDEKNK